MKNSASRFAAQQRCKAVVGAWAALASAFLAVGAPLLAQNPQTGGGPQVAASEPTRLELDKPVDVEMKGRQTRSYRIHAEAGQFIHVVVVQNGIDVAVTLFDPAGHQLAQTDTMNGAYGPEPISAVALTTGNYRLDVSSLAANAPAGKCEVRLTDLRAPTEADRTRMRAEQVYMEGVALCQKGDAASKRAAETKWSESFSLWKSLDDNYEQALSLQSIGDVHTGLGEYQKALDYYNQALPFARAVGDRAIEAVVLGNTAFDYDNLGEEQKALEYNRQALPLVRAVGDRVDEAVVLLHIASAYYDLGEEQKALEYDRQALPLMRAVGNRSGEARTLNDIGLVYKKLGEMQKALDYYGQALDLDRAIGDRAGEVRALNNIGGVYDDLGEMQKALDYYNQGLPLARAEGDKRGEGILLLGMGRVCDRMGERQKALEYYSQARPLFQAAGDPLGEETALSNTGVIYGELGEYTKALEYYNQALPLQQAEGNHEAWAMTLKGIGAAYHFLKENQKALDYYNQALRIEQAAGFRGLEADTLNNIGTAYNDLGERQKALDYFNQALVLHQAAGNRRGEALTLLNIGLVYRKLGEEQKALDYYGQALPLFRAVQDPAGEANVFVSLMLYWRGLDNPSLAILFGKLAVDRFQQLRSNIQGLEKAERESYLSSIAKNYRELADLLVSEGRLPEALQVLDMLKIEEYSEFTRHRGKSSSESSPVAYTPAEENAKAQYEAATASAMADGREWTELRAKRSRTPSEQQRYDELSQRLTADNSQTETFLHNLYNTFGKGDQANERLRNIKEATSGLKKSLADFGPGAVGISTVVLDEKVDVILVTPAVTVAHEVPIRKLALRNKVFALSNDLVVPPVSAGTAASSDDRDAKVRAKAADLYKVLIAPIEKDLQDVQAKTLVWQLDDVLHYVPLAALYDGKQFLVERYQNVVITTSSLSDVKDQPQVSAWRGLAMGVSKDYDGLGELTAVPEELAAVVHSAAVPSSHGPVAGTILLDDSFTEKAMESHLEGHPPLVHIASHFVFNQGDDTKSYLLLGGKDTGGEGFHLTLADLRDDPRLDFRGIELLTLAGCQTGLGSNSEADGFEIDGLGMTAHDKGAKAVMATLWAIDDPSVASLMTRFYELLTSTQSKMTKAEALQQAQLALLHGIGASASGPPRYADPYYWAPFILIGNWK